MTQSEGPVRDSGGPPERVMYFQRVFSYCHSPLCVERVCARLGRVNFNVTRAATAALNGLPVFFFFFLVREIPSDVVHNGATASQKDDHLNRI